MNYHFRPFVPAIWGCFKKGANSRLHTCYIPAITCYLTIVSTWLLGSKPAINMLLTINACVTCYLFPPLYKGE